MLVTFGPSLLNSVGRLERGAMVVRVLILGRRLHRGADTGVVSCWGNSPNGRKQKGLV
jgi:hypothetical protein